MALYVGHHVGHRSARRASRLRAAIARFSRVRCSSPSSVDVRLASLTSENRSQWFAGIHLFRTYKQKAGGSSPPTPTSVRLRSGGDTCANAGGHRAYIARAVRDARALKTSGVAGRVDVDGLPAQQMLGRRPAFGLPACLAADAAFDDLGGCCGSADGMECVGRGGQFLDLGVAEVEVGRGDV